MFSPPQSWANSDDCGVFPCTAPLNALLSFTGTTFEGPATPTATGADFEIIANNAQGV